MSLYNIIIIHQRKCEHGHVNIRDEENNMSLYNISIIHQRKYEHGNVNIRDEIKRKIYRYIT